MRHTLIAALASAALLGGCGDKAKLDVASGQGPNPNLPAPNKTLFPTVNFAKAIGWPAGAKPATAAGLAVDAFAEGLDHPRWAIVLPNGDVLVTETNTPPKPDDGKGIKGWLMKRVMARAGAGTPSANRITLLRDADGDGKAETRSVLISGLNSPFGMALVGDQLYVADTDKLLRFPYTPGATQITAKPVKIADLPAGPINHHWTKNVIAGPDGSKLYVTVGSNSNVGENGLAAETGRAAIWEIDAKTGAHRIFAGGLRNPNGLAWEPTSGLLWTTVNERDEIGSDLVPDYMTSVQLGDFFGWPWNYWGDNIDVRVKEPKPGGLEVVRRPDYALGPHTASLGLAFANGARLGPRFAQGAFVGQHGSWNRKPFSGYKVVFVPFAGGKPAGKPIDVLTGFLDENEQARGRPVGVAVDKGGGLLVVDDVGNKIWRVRAAETAAATRKP